MRLLKSALTLVSAYSMHTYKLHHAGHKEAPLRTHLTKNHWALAALCSKKSRPGVRSAFVISLEVWSWVSDNLSEPQFPLLKNGSPGLRRMSKSVLGSVKVSPDLVILKAAWEEVQYYILAQIWIPRSSGRIPHTLGSWGRWVTGKGGARCDGLSNLNLSQFSLVSRLWNSLLPLPGTFFPTLFAVVIPGHHLGLSSDISSSRRFPFASLDHLGWISSVPRFLGLLNWSMNSW